MKVVKALVTGSEGFVGHYMRDELESNGYEVFGIDLIDSKNTSRVDLLDTEAVNSYINELKPNVIIHLAGQANVGVSWKMPQKTIEVNVVGAINLLEAVKNNDLRTHIVIVGSADQYGSLGKNGACVVETLETKPQSPYGVSKKAQEDMAKLYADSFGINVCMTRSFNHYGPGQKQGFLIPDFVSQIVKIENGEQESICVGNLEAERDFTHVRDVVRAYRLIAENGCAGEIYNVGSGTSYKVQTILDKLIKMSRTEVKVVSDPERMRPSDVPVIRCNHDKLTADTGWIPSERLEDGLEETLDYWRNIR